MEEKDLRKIARLVERPDIVAMTLAEVMVTLVFLVFIIGMASGAFATGQEPTREELVKENARLVALEDGLVRGLGKMDVVPADVDRVFSRLVDITRLQQDLVRLKEELDSAHANLRDLKSSLSSEARDWFAKYTAAQQAASAAERTLAGERKARQVAERKAVDAVRKAQELTRALADTRQGSQIVQSRLAALEKKVDGRGIDAPACWRADDRPNGALEYVLRLRLRDSDMLLASTWPASRNDQAAALGLPPAGTVRLVTPEEFMALARPLYDDSVRRGCRYFVEVDDQGVQQVDALRSQRALVERYFYVKWGRHYD